MAAAGLSGPRRPSYSSSSPPEAAAAPLGQALADLHLAPGVGRLVEALAGQRVGQVGLRHVVALEVVRVAVLGAVAHLAVEAGDRVAQLGRDRQGAALAHRAARGRVGGQRRVRLGRAGQVHRRLGQRQHALGQADQLERLQRRGGHHERLRVGVAHVLGGEDDHAAQDEARLLARLQHARHPVDRGVRIGAAHALDERAHDAVVLVAGLVVEQRALLQRLLDVLGADAYRLASPSASAGPVAGGQVGRHLERVEHAARVAARLRDQLVERLAVQLDAAPAQAALAVGQRARADRAQRLLPERLEPHHPAARQQRRDHLEGRVLGRRTHEDDRAGLDVGQERILLRAREAVDLVHEQDRARAVEVASLGRRRDRLAHILHPGVDRRHRDEVGPLAAGQQARQCSLSGTRGSPQQQGWESPPSCNPRQQLSWGQEVVLTDEFVECRRPHSLGKGLIYALSLRAALEQVHVFCH